MAVKHICDRCGDPVTVQGIRSEEKRSFVHDGFCVQATATRHIKNSQGGWVPADLCFQCVNEVINERCINRPSKEAPTK